MFRLFLAIPAFCALLAQCDVHKVTVGNGGFRYQPNVTHAAVGDIVQFEFFPPNHSVYKAVYTDDPACPGGYCNPCVPSNLYFPKQHFFFSGLINVDQNQVNNPPTWNLTINDTQPIFFSCNAPDSCHPNGMVGVINPNSSVSLAKQMQAAADAQYQLSPGQQFPAEGSSPTSSSSPSSSSPAAGSGHKSGLSGGAIAGIVVGCVAGVALGGLVLYFCGKSRAYDQIFKAGRSEADAASAPAASEAGGPTATWVAAQQGQSPREKDPEAQRASYMSGTTAQGHQSPHTSMLPQSPDPSKQFVGFNRQSGQPEFLAEVPGSGHAQEIAELPAHSEADEQVGQVGSNVVNPRAEVEGSTPVEQR